uniref:Uncharacterized protein n=1 Tax=Pseudictyota dubia TaxID=2749911 RepID=A0A7R9YYX9_9STRA|mmetsp:Transcript_15467/g.29402  ORF Transcript_15467/g.29402 Transcript_15467/m.29402 type:complete len:200 (+) Transcript_15467:110-709(+)|eukprot:CAMPEP_0197448484 /NCGR_PEP_ID=MMETSP1175-20131217/17644_1 /TAXON_ID=1003142 /ORGANISM="Triceratium dubium, Strain CCMP147" /LENGTH=199 /DNA_ID=CAMNT_0042980247 /DNA_START=121 /DNA_END=720 /DNA_ORIENTATION=+
MYSQRREQAFEENGAEPYGTIEEPKECLEDFRRKWIPGFGNVFNSAADVGGDWYYFYSVWKSLGGGGDNLIVEENLDLLVPLFVVTVASTVIFLLVIVTYFTKAGDPNREVCCVDSFKRFCMKFCCCWRKELDTNNFLSLVEDVAEDIPTIALTAMIDFRRQGGISPAGVFSITTSVFNLFYNMLQRLIPKEKQAQKGV